MNLPILDIIVYLNLIGLVLLAALFFAVILLNLRIKKSYKDQDKFLAEDKRLKVELSDKIEEIAKERINEIIGRAGENLDHDIRARLEELSDLVSKKGVEISDFVAKQQTEQVRESQYFVANMLSKVEKESEEYRKNKLGKIDEEIRQIVLSAAREVIGRAISLSEHEDLVNKALEKAKKEHIFT